MPYAAKKQCKQWPCPELVESGYCKAHAKAYEKQRGTPAERGYDAQWRKVRLIAFVRDEWRCVDCGWEPDIVVMFRNCGLGLPSPAHVLEELRRRLLAGEQHLHGDHIVPIEQRPDLRLVLSNIATRCKSCHSRKTMSENGISR